MSEAYWDKVTDFADEPVVQCDVPAVKNTSLDDGNNDICKKELIGIFNVLFLKLILCIVLVSYETEACNLIQTLSLVPEWPHWFIMAFCYERVQIL